MNEYRLSIDYGTTNTVAFLQPPHGDAVALSFDGRPLLPSAVWVAPDRQLLTGQRAVRSAGLDAGRYEPNPKRRIAHGTVLLGDEEYEVAQLIGATLARVRAQAQEQAGNAPLRVILTHPAAWEPSLLKLLRDAAGYAEIDRPELVTEPEAAAAHLVAAGLVGDGAPLVVYDLGAGTCDITAVLRSGYRFDRLATAGLGGVGGLDLDEAVRRLVGRTLADSHPDEWVRLTQPVGSDRHLALRLWEDCRLAKERLSTERMTYISVPLVNQDVRILRADFEEVARPLLEPTVTKTVEVLRRARVGRDDHAELVLVGGASRTPLVSMLLTQSTSRLPRRLDDPELVVARGALDYLAMANNELTGRPPVRARAQEGVTLHDNQTAPDRTISLPATRQVPATSPAGGYAPTVVAAGDPVAVTVPVGVGPPPHMPPAGMPPVPGQRRPSGPHRKFIPNAQTHLKPLVYAGAATLLGLIFWAWVPGVLFKIVGFLLIVLGAAAFAAKLVTAVLAARHTREMVIDRTGITITRDGGDTVFAWSDIEAVYVRRHHLTRWLVCMPAHQVALSGADRVARYWSHPHGLFLLTSVSGHDEAVVRDALELYGANRYQR